MANAVKLIYAKRPYAAVRGRARVAPGDKLYAVQDTSTGLYFIWAYLSRDTAEIIAQRVSPGGEMDIAANWRRDPRDLHVTSLRKEAL